MKKNVRNVLQEIKWYQPAKATATTMLKLANLGFDCSGHGVGFGGEDFGFRKDYKNLGYLSINLSDRSKNDNSIFFETENFRDNGVLVQYGNYAKIIKLAKLWDKFFEKS